MIDRSWNIEDVGPEEDYDSGRPPVLATLHFLRAAVRRRWLMCVGAACVGALLGLGASLLVPPTSVGTVTVLLAHDPAVEPTLAMATDVSLLRTRTVAAQAVDELDLKVTPEEFQESVTVVPDTSSILVINVVGDDDADARTRARVLGDVFLDFRRAHLEDQATARVKSYEDRVAALTEQGDSLTKQYTALAAGGSLDTTQASDVLTQRSQVNAEITRLQQVIEDTALEASALVAASHVLDPARAVPQSPVKRSVLATGSGLIGGAALSLGLVIFSALTSDRLTRRGEIGLALGLPVRASVGRLSVARSWRSGGHRLPGLDLHVLLHTLDPLFVRPDDRQARVAVLSVDSGADGELVTAAMAARLAHRGLAVFVVDLGAAGHVSRALAKVLGEGPPVASAPAVFFRPLEVPRLSRGPVGLPGPVSSVLPPKGPRRQAFDAADVALTFFEVDPALSVDGLGSWADRAIILVTAGRSSAERLRTAAELVRSAGLTPEFALLVGADSSDESLGLPDAQPSSPVTRGRSVSS